MKQGLIIRREPYLISNIIFAGAIVLIMAYAAIFSPEKDSYPVSCIHEKLTGETCASCGLSHSFSLILRGRIEESYQWNENGMKVFIFFVSQLLMRIFFSRFYIKNPGSRKQLIQVDIIGSAAIFLIAFMPFIVSIINWL